jgi:O-antigen ligase
LPSLSLAASITGSHYLSSVSGRTTIWRLALDEWARHPLLGYGPNMFSRDYLATHFPPTLQQATNGHNQIVQTLADSGVLGAAAMALVLIAAATAAWRGRSTDAGLTVGLVGVFFTFCLTETPLRTVGLVAVPALATLGLVLTNREVLEPVADRSPSERELRPQPSTVLASRW